MKDRDADGRFAEAARAVNGPMKAAAADEKDFHDALFRG